MFLEEKRRWKRVKINKENQLFILEHIFSSRMQEKVYAMQCGSISEKISALQKSKIIIYIKYQIRTSILSFEVLVNNRATQQRFFAIICNLSTQCGLAVLVH